MERTFLADFVEKIEELAAQQVEPEIETINGVQYVRTYDGYSLLQKPSIRPISTNSLSGVVDLVKTYIQEVGLVDTLYGPFIVNVDFNDITVYSGLDFDTSRQTLITSRPFVPNLNMGYSMSVEEMIILLSTSFIPTENTEKFINSLSSLRVVEEVEFNDDGVGQTVTAKKGASMNAKFQVQPIVKLKPIRTYADIEQVESKFLFRVNKDGSVRLREADGGQWKYEAQKRIVEFLENEMTEMIENNEVVVIG